MAKNDPRRKQQGIYFAKDYHVADHSIKLIILDTRYFRTELTPDLTNHKRYIPNKYGQGTMLGQVQWLQV